MAQELASIITIAMTMILFAFVAFSIEENRWLKNMFFLFSLLLVPVLLYVGMITASINGLASVSSILERIYGALVIVYFFIVAMFVVKFIVFMFNMYSIKKQRDADADIDDI